MQIPFWKYHGNGNDFIIVNGMDEPVNLNTDRISQLCHRQFGIGADGLMILRHSDSTDFGMDYYNSDGRLSSLCGNGGRCIALFAYLNGLADKKMTFEAYDGLHGAEVLDEIEIEQKYQVCLQMADVTEVERNRKFYFLDTGSPHYVEFVKNLNEFDVVSEGSKTRYSERFAPDGVNVNFAEIKENSLFVRTYERGVENETLSCGTGVTASAIAAWLETGKKNLPVITPGGEFRVDFNMKNDTISQVRLTGPATQVFKGEIKL